MAAQLHVLSSRQFDAAAGQVLAAAWAAGAGPGRDEKLTVDLDSTHCQTYLRHEALCCIPRAAGGLEVMFLGLMAYRTSKSYRTPEEVHDEYLNRQQAA